MEQRIKPSVLLSGQEDLTGQKEGNLYFFVVSDVNHLTLQSKTDYLRILK